MDILQPELDATTRQALVRLPRIALPGTVSASRSVLLAFCREHGPAAWLVDARGTQLRGRPETWERELGVLLRDLRLPSGARIAILADTPAVDATATQARGGARVKIRCFRRPENAAAWLAHAPPAACAAKTVPAVPAWVRGLLQRRRATRFGGGPVALAG